MSIKKQSYGLTSDAALVRAAVETRISFEKAEEYVDLIFSVFEVNGKDSYEKMLTILQEERNLQSLAETIDNRSDSKKLFDFVKSFLGVEAYKKENKEVMKIFKERGTDIFEDNVDIFAHVFDEDLDFTNIESEEEHVLYILDCDIKTEYLADNELFQYIEIPSESFEDLESDFETAHHLKLLSEIRDNREANGKLMLICHSKETGLIAMRYLSTLVPEIENYEECEDDKITFHGRIPIVNAEEIDKAMQQEIFNKSPFFSGSFVFQSVQTASRLEPWWMKYEEIPLIVVIRKGCYLSEEFVEKLDVVGKSRAIFVIIEKDKNRIDDKKNKGDTAIVFSSDINVIANEISFTLTYNTYEIEEPDVTSEYMKKVFMDSAMLNSYRIGEDVDVEEILKLLKKNRGQKWEGNSTVIQLIKKAVSLKKNQCGVLNKEDFTFLEHSLITVKNKKVLSKDEKKAENAIERMNKYIFGLEHVKKTILDNINMLEINRIREKQGIKPIKINNVFAFYGPPGVGKTEMARYFGDIMIEKNLLSGNRFISINGAQLKGAFVGHTAPKVASIFENNDVIFIDECYSLTASESSTDTFSEEALAELCVQLEEHGKDRLIIFAGYGGDVSDKNNKMKQFIDANPGLASRISFHVNFPSYTPEEMLSIFERMVTNYDYVLEKGWRNIALEFFRKRENTDSYGNGREARKLFQNISIFQSARLSRISYDIEDLKLIKLEDIEEAVKIIAESDNKISGKQKTRIGF